jgi:hypothetical protein
VLDRIDRERAFRVRCPERGLVNETGIADRETIHLPLLDGAASVLYQVCPSDAEPGVNQLGARNRGVTVDGVRAVPSQVPPTRAVRGHWATPWPGGAHYTLARTLLVSKPLEPTAEVRAEG